MTAIFIFFFIIFIYLSFTFFISYYYTYNFFAFSNFSVKKNYKQIFFDNINFSEEYKSINSFKNVSNNFIVSFKKKIIFFFDTKITNFIKLKQGISNYENVFFFSNKNYFYQISSKFSNDWYYNDYKILIILFIVSFSLSFIIFILSNIIGNSPTIYFERAKFSVYECGFQPFERIDKCQIFIFYRLAIFFIIFEAELIFLFPWAINVCEYSLFSIEYFYNAFFFIFILFFGFFYEIKNKALDF